MSIITDALQKVQRRPAFEPMTPNPPPPQRSWWPAALAISVALVAAVWLWPSQPTSYSPARSRPKPAPPAPAPQPIVSLMPAAPSTPAMTWKIDGVIVGMGKPTAIINGQLVAEGENVKGAKVVRVDTERVELLHEGEVVNLEISE